MLDQRIDLRRFSAGSFAALSTLQLLWKIPNVVTNGKLGAIACPPQLIVTPPVAHTLHLLHYEADQLCVWKPGQHQLDQLQIRYTYVSTEGPAYKEHFGAKEHNYSHWLTLNHAAGWWDLARFLFVHPEAACSALNDEGQQYGNLDEASRVPRKGLVVWCGDHKQTPGGLRKSYEARAFRRKLMRRPIALRGDTKFIPPHMLGAIVHPYVQDVPGLQVAGLRQLLHESTRQPLGLSTGSVAVFQELCQETIGRSWDAGITPCCCAAIAVLWLALAPERFPLQAERCRHSGKAEVVPDFTKQC